MSVDVLISHHLPLYREVLVSTIRAACPGLVVQPVLQEELEHSITTFHPQMVICGAASPVIRSLCSTWISLFPEDADEAIVNMSGERRTIAHPSITQLIDLVRGVQPEE